jgi:hypothetical protein
MCWACAIVLAKIEKIMHSQILAGLSGKEPVGVAVSSLPVKITPFLFQHFEYLSIE